MVFKYFPLTGHSFIEQFFFQFIPIFNKIGLGINVMIPSVSHLIVNINNDDAADVLHAMLIYQMAIGTRLYE